MKKTEQLNEAKVLATRFRLEVNPVLNWMKAHSLYTILDIKNHFPGKSQPEAMDAAINEIWDMALSA